MKTITCPVVMYPEGVIIGKVKSGKFARSGRIRYGASDTDGRYIGTFDTFPAAKQALEDHFREGIVL